MRPHTYDLDSLGWTPALAAAFEPYAGDGLVAGRVGGEHRGRFVVLLERGERLAEPSGRLRRSDPGEWPGVGDWVACRLPRGDGPTVIASVLPRTTAFQRDAADLARRGATGVRGQVVAANVDLVVVVTSLVGDLSLRRLERYLASAWSSGAQPAIVLTKTDLCGDIASPVAEVERIALGVPILAVSNVTGEGVDSVAALVEPGRTAVLVGSSGVGKSSLLNRLAGEDLAIVTAIPGTTRDTVRQAIELDGVPLNVVDTAGLRESTDEVERLGIARTWSEIERADLLLLVVDAREGVAAADETIVARLPARLKRVIVHNKIDLADERPRAEDRADGTHVFVSAKTGAGVDLLGRTLLALSGWAHDAGESVFMARERHLVALRRAGERLAAAAGVFGQAELLAEELRLAQAELAAITGEFTADDLLGEIFSRFCIGK